MKYGLDCPKVKTIWLSNMVLKVRIAARSLNLVPCVITMQYWLVRM